MEKRLLADCTPLYIINIYQLNSWLHNILQANDCMHHKIYPYKIGTYILVACCILEFQILYILPNIF